MKYIATIIKTIEYQTPIWARNKRQATELLDELDESDFMYQDVVDMEVKLEQIDEEDEK